MIGQNLSEYLSPNNESIQHNQTNADRTKATSAVNEAGSQLG